MNLLKKTLGFLVLLSTLLIINASATFADSETPTCMTGQSRDATINWMGADGSYVVTELNEPLSAIDEVIVSNNITTSQVFLKYKCHAAADNETEGTSYLNSIWGENDAGEPVLVDGSAGDTWFYIPATWGACPEGASCTYVQILIGTSGTGLLKTYIAIIYRWAASIVGIISILVIVVSGIQISMDQGSGEQVGEAKNRIMQSLAGLVILFLSALILYTINPTFFTA